MWTPWRRRRPCSTTAGGVPAFVLIRILAPAFFARQDTKTPMRFALISVAANVVFGIGLFRLVGFQGIAAATAIAAWINVILMLIALMRRRFYNPSPETMTRLVKLLFASAALGRGFWPWPPPSGPITSTHSSIARRLAGGGGGVRAGRRRLRRSAGRPARSDAGRVPRRPEAVSPLARLIHRDFRMTDEKPAAYSGPHPRVVPASRPPARCTSATISAP